MDQPLPRRKALKWIWAAAGTGLALLCGAGLRYLFPNNPPIRKTRFRLGKAGEYPMGQADTRHKKELNLFIVRDEKGFTALSADCTHLGCSIDWFGVDGQFRCPCHGSRFDLAGKNLTGPAPRPLERFPVEIDPEGRLVVDKGTRA